MENSQSINEIFYQTVRLALTGKTQEIRPYLSRISNKTKNKNDLLWIEIKRLLENSSDKNHMSIVREAVACPPVDRESKNNLLTELPYPISLDVIPVWSVHVKDSLERLITERNKSKLLNEKGLKAAQSAIFSGMPGVGKTLAAKWLANSLKLPLFTLNLSSVMSSLLGRTGNNIRSIFQYANAQPCILLLDEFDAIAKKRNDDTEIGELKRLVTVLLQEIDQWSDQSILIAATNHPELLDPAVWRRFDLNIAFDLPSRSALEVLLVQLFKSEAKFSDNELSLLSLLCLGKSYSDVTKLVLSLRKSALLDNVKISEKILKWCEEEIANKPKEIKIEIASSLLKMKLSQRKVSELTGISRPTLKKITT